MHSTYNELKIIELIIIINIIIYFYQLHDVQFFYISHFFPSILRQFNVFIEKIMALSMLSRGTYIIRLVFGCSAAQHGNE